MGWVLLSRLNTGNGETTWNVAPAWCQVVGQGRFPGGSVLLNQDLNRQGDVVGNEGEESIPYVKTACKRSGEIFEEL